MYCKVCGENLKPDAKFCENCGTKVKKETDAIPKTDIKKSTEPVKPKVKLEETKTSKKKIIVGVIFVRFWHINIFTVLEIFSETFDVLKFIG